MGRIVINIPQDIYMTVTITDEKVVEEILKWLEKYADEIREVEPEE
jgi:hypothetical protein